MLIHKRPIDSLPVAHRCASLLPLLLCLLSQPRSAAAGITPTMETLPNGMRIVVAADPATPIVTAGLWVSAGRAQNPRGQEGLADLVARCDARRVIEALQANEDTPPYLAEALQVNVFSDHTRFHLTVLPEHVEAALGALRALLPGADETFASAPSLKRAALGGLMRNRTNPSVVAQEAFTAAACGMRRPLGQAASFASVFGLGSDAVADFHRRYVVPEGTVLTLTGDLDGQPVIEAATRRFGDWEAREPASAPWARSPRRPPHAGVHLIDDPNAERTVVLGGIAGPGRESDHYADLQLLHLVLSSGSASAGVRRLTAGDRLGHEFIGRLRPSARGALLTMHAVVAHAHAVPVLTLLQEEMEAEKIAALPTTLLGGLLTARRQEILLADDDPSTALRSRLPFMLAGRGLADTGLMARLDLDAWREYVREVLAPERLCWIVVGRADELAPLLEGAGIQFETASNLDVVTGRLFRPAQGSGSAIWSGEEVTSAEIISAEELLLRAVDARGGFEMLERVKSYRAERTLYRKPSDDMTLSSDSVVRVRFPDRYREDWGMALPTAADSTQKLTLCQVVNGREVWRRQMGKERAANQRRTHELRFRLWSDELRVLLRYGEEGTRIRPLEPEVMAGVSTPGLQLDSPDGFWVRIYFHPQSFQIVQRVYQREGERAPVIIEQMFTDYRQVGGIFLPFKSAINEGGQYIGENHLQLIEYNVLLPDDLYERTEY